MRGTALPCSRGFTLIEILVVVSVIGLLVAILVPSLARSREQARSVICQSNLKQWGHAMMMYVQAHNDVLPFENRGQEASHGRICWFDALDRQFSATRTAEADRNVKICPTVARRDPNSEESYRMNSKLAETNEASPYYMPYRKVFTLDRPTQTVLLFDADVGGSTISFKGRWKLNGDEINYRHGRRTNLLFTDWHVVNLKRKDVFDQSIKNEPIVWQPKDVGDWDPDPGPGA